MGQLCGCTEADVPPPQRAEIAEIMGRERVSIVKVNPNTNIQESLENED